MKAAPFGDYSNEQTLWICCSGTVVFGSLKEPNYCLTLCCPLMAPWCNSTQKTTSKRRPPCHVTVFECATKSLCLLAVIWSWECAFSSTAPLSSSGSSRRMPGNTPAVRATAWAYRPQHQPTWLFSVSVAVATMWRGRGGETVQQLCGENSSSSMEAAIWQRCSNAVMQSNLSEFAKVRHDWQGAHGALLRILSFQLDFIDTTIIYFNSSLIPVPKDWDNLSSESSFPVFFWLHEKETVTILFIGSDQWQRIATSGHMMVHHQHLCCHQLICSRVAPSHWLLWGRAEGSQHYGQFVHFSLVIFFIELVK